MKSPTLFGHPLWRGKVKRRVAKKYVGDLLYYAKLFQGYGKGSLVRSCSGLNHKVSEIYPEYRRRRKFEVLVDLDLAGDDGMVCSLRHCVMGPPLTHEQAEQYRENVLNGANAKEWDFDIRFSKEVMTIHEDGTFTLNRVREKELERERHGTRN